MFTNPMVLIPVYGGWGIAAVIVLPIVAALYKSLRDRNR